MLTRHSKQMFSFAMLTTAVIEAIRKLDPRVQVRRPVMMTVYVGSLMTTALAVQSALQDTGESSLFVGSIAAWLWFTVLFANFAEAIAEGRGKAQAANLRQARVDIVANRLPDLVEFAPEFHQLVRSLESKAVFGHQLVSRVPASQLRKGNLVLTMAGDLIPADGEIVVGIASVNESAITGESAPVIRESGGDRSSVTGGDSGSFRLAGDSSLCESRGNIS